MPGTLAIVVESVVRANDGGGEGGGNPCEGVGVNSVDGAGGGDF